MRSVDRPNIRSGLVVGLVLGTAASAGFVLSNLGPASKSPSSDNPAAVLGGYLAAACIFVTLGFVLSRRDRPVRDCAVVAAISGLVTLVLVAATLTVVDNVWLSTVARQPDKIDGLAHSHWFHTMRAYVNGQLLIGLSLAAPIVAAGCAALGALGAHLGHPPTSDQPAVAEPR